MFLNKKTKKGKFFLFAVCVCMVLGSGMCTGCRNGSSEPKTLIESITFESDKINLLLGEELTIKVTAKPDESVKNETIKYTAVTEGVVEIREPYNGGLVLKALSSGSTVITAKTKNVTSYMQVTVENNAAVQQYINVTTPVIELEEGEKRQVQVSLYGGNELDNSEFAWRLEKGGEDCISVDATQNIAVVTGIKRGHRKLIIEHPKTFANEILFFVKGAEETIKYLTSANNVIVVPVDRSLHGYAVTLVNGTDEEKGAIHFEVTSGQENVTITPNRNIVEIMGLKEGRAVIEATHPQVEAPFTIQVITVDVDLPYIAVDRTLAILNVGEYVNIEAKVENARIAAQSINQFTCQKEESASGVINVIQNDNHFYVQALQGGNARLVISNEESPISREVLIVVRPLAVPKDNFFITTNQNLVMTQVGGKETVLTMKLVGGNSADANGFEWVCDDSGVISVESAHGKVTYRKRAEEVKGFDGIAVITPLKIGTAKITISHPKSESTMTVVVKVYPRNTFLTAALNVGGGGLFKVVKGTLLPVELSVISGDRADLGSLQWKMEDGSIAGVDESLHGLSNVINGLKTGYTKLIVSGSCLEYPSEAMVLSGTPEELSLMSVLYVDSMYQKLAVDQIVRLPVNDSQGLYGEDNTFTVSVDNKDILYAVMVKNQLVMQGKRAGEAKLIIRHPSAMNALTLSVRVDPATVNVNKPYYLSGEDIKGIVKNVSGSYAVNLVGAPYYEEGNIKWTAEDSSVLEMTSNGKTATFRGKEINRQTMVKINHPKSINEKAVLVYVVENESDLYNRVALGLANDHLLLGRGEETLVTLITNANAGQQEGIRWNIAQGNDVVTLESYYDSAMIRAHGVGNAKIEISHEQNIIPVYLYISVVEGFSDEKTVQGPAVIEVIKGETKIVKLATKNVTPQELQGFTWKSENESVANITPQDESAIFTGLQKGVTYVNIHHPDLGYQHRATLLCANTPEELKTMYVLGVEASRHVMTVGDEKRVKLEFGSAGFPENEKGNIKWTADSGGVVRAVSGGDYATIVAVQEGIGTVTVASNASFNKEITIEFEVHPRGVANPWVFKNYDKITGMVVGDNKKITMKLYDGDKEMTGGYSLIWHENEYDSIIQVNRTDNVLDITAKSYGGASSGVGQSYITVGQKEKVIEPARVLVYVAKDKETLDSYYPIAVDKTNYLVTVNEPVVINLTTIAEKDAANEQYIGWDIENSGILYDPVFAGKKQVTLKGKSAGQCVININFKGVTVNKVYIAVIENSKIDLTKSIVTESIIGMVKGTSRETVIQCNLTGSEISQLKWESGNEKLVTVTGDGTKAVITANPVIPANNETYVTVSYGSWLKRSILVYVCNDENAVRQYKAMNIDNQYYRMGRGETVIVPAYYAPNKTDKPTIWTDKYDNKVVSFTASDSGGKLEITGVNEGVAVLEGVNGGLSNVQNSLKLYVEVSNQYVNMPKAPNMNYLTADKTVYVLNPDEPERYADITVSGVGMTSSELQKIQWEITEGPQYVTIYPNGSRCRVMSNTQEGASLIRASCANNYIEIKVIVTRNLAGPDIPYIDIDDVIRLGNGENRAVTVTVANAGSFNKNLFKAEVVQGNDKATASMTGDMLVLKGVKPGQALVKISCPTVALFDKEVMVIVANNAEGVTYLTTQDNFTVIKRGENKVINVSLAGFDDNTGSGYTWTLEKGHESFITMTASGKQAQIYGKELGTAKITVRHTLVDSDFYISLYVRVVENDYAVKYIDTPRTIINVTEGTSAYIPAELVNGRPEEVIGITWTSSDDSIVKIEGYGSQVYALGVKSGTAKITAEHINSANKVDIIVIVEPDRTREGVFIETNNSLVQITPQESWQLTAALTGNVEANEQYGFRWEIIDYRSDEKEGGTNKNKPVISIVANADGAYVTGINEGEATVEVSHPLTNYKVDFKITVQYGRTLVLGAKHIQITVGETKTVGITVPYGVKVFYESSDYNGEQIVDVFGTAELCVVTGLKEGVTTVTAVNQQRTASVELLVEVKKNPHKDFVMSYISIPQTVYTLKSSETLTIGNAHIKGVKYSNKEAAFTTADDAGIKWKVADGWDCLTINNYNAQAVITAASVNFEYLKEGPVEVILTHDEIPGYSKRIYINCIYTSSVTNIKVNDYWVYYSCDDLSLPDNPAGESYRNDWQWSHWTKYARGDNGYYGLIGQAPAENGIMRCENNEYFAGWDYLGAASSVKAGDIIIFRARQTAGADKSFYFTMSTESVTHNQIAFIDNILTNEWKYFIGIIPFNGFLRDLVRESGSIGFFEVSDMYAGNAAYLSTTTLKDNSGNKRNMIIDKGIAPTQGKFGDGIIFTGTGGCMTKYPNESFKPQGDFAISFWMYKDSTASEIQQHMLGNWETGGFGFINMKNGTLRLQAYSEGSYRNFDMPYVPFNTWTHIVMNYDSATYTVTLKINNNYTAVFTLPGKLKWSTSNVSFALGGNPANGQGVWNSENHFIGRLDEIALYLRQLSDADIRYLYEYQPVKLE